MSGIAQSLRVVVVGAGHAGGRVAQHLHALGHTGPITLIGEEPHAPYERPALSKELVTGHKHAQELTLGPSEFWAPRASAASNVQRLVARVSAVDRDERRLVLDDGHHVAFDRLVVATGGTPRRPPIDGADLPGVRVLRTLDDALRLKADLELARSIVIVGAGVIGMEVAASAAALGVHATVLEAGDRVMARCVPPAIGGWLAATHRAHGVTIHTGAAVRAIAARGTGAAGFRVDFADAGGARHVDADRVLLAAGIDFSAPFLDGTGIATAAGIPVDAGCRSPLADWCYAAGDVALTESRRYGRALRQETWRNAENQARAVAEFIHGRSEPYDEIPWMWTDQFGRNIQVVGLPGADDVSVVRGDAAFDGPATVVHLRDGIVTGAVMLDRGRDRRALEALLGMDVRDRVGALADASVPLKELGA
ncbi:NAD(P)/FAD-dependent oxidoreductase [Burkholderia sp. MR1-5-21]